MLRDDVYSSTVEYFLQPVAAFRADPSVTEIMINGPDQIFIERGGQIIPTEATFESTDMLDAAVQNIAEYVGRPFDDHNLSMDGRLPDGSRIHAIASPASRNGLCVTIRKFREAAFTLDELVTSGSMAEEVRELLVRSIEAHKNIVVAGGTGTGKTSLLNALSREISASERIVVIEESSELRLVQPHTIYLEAQPAVDDGQPGVTLRDLFVNALRMRPDRILIGEVRRGEALELVQSMLSGHAGSLSTLHASNPQAAATRLETLCLMNDTQLPVYVARAQVAAAIDLFVQTRRLASGQRCITEVASLQGLDPNEQFQFELLYQK